MIGLGIDAGASSTRWRLIDSTGELARGTTDPITGHIFTASDRETNLNRLHDLLTSVLAVATPDAVVAGMTGLHQHTDAHALLVNDIIQKLGLPAGKVVLDNDLNVAYLGVFAPGEGILLYAGTGAVAYHQTADGGEVRAGGYGYLIDDAGAGFWIGQQALRQVLRWVDEGGQPSDALLASHIYDALGTRTWPDIMATVYGGGRSKVAALVPVVVAAADAGDSAALAILQQAGRELARLAKDIQHRLAEPLPVAFSGGIAQHAQQVVASVQAELADVQVVTAEADVVAARLALKLVN
ncbi:MAG: BadF/BadG/BcrA/BcrD ATPase family protein [Deinococcota bacterium]